MRRSLSVILVGVMIVSDLCMSPLEVKASLEEASYGGSYGSQLEDVREDGYSKMIYDEMVKKYVWTENGTDTNLARPVENDDTNIVMDFSNLVYRVEVADGEEAKVAIDAWAQNIQSIFGKAVNDAFAAFTRDYPEVFWVKNVSYGVSISTTLTSLLNGTRAEAGVIKFTIQPEEAFDGATTYIRSFNEAVIATKSNLISAYGFNQNSKQADIARAIHDYLAQKLDYNYDAAQNGEANQYRYAFTPTVAFVQINKDNKVVCEGYAKAFKILADQFGIENALLTGNSVNPGGDMEAHMWNAVKLEDGKWYAVDATWDDQEDRTYYHYFLAGQNSKGFRYVFYKDHIVNAVFSGYEQAKEFAVPQIAENGYFGNEVETTEPATTKNNDKKNYNVEREDIYIDVNSGSNGSNTTNGTTGTNGTNSAGTVANYSGTNSSNTTSGANASQTASGGYSTTGVAGTYVITGITSGTSSQKTSSDSYVNGTWKIYNLKNAAYTGKAITQNIRIECDGVVLKEGTDYYLDYHNNINVGTATIHVIPAGKYIYTKSKDYTFKITKASVSKVSSKKIKAKKYNKGKAIKPALKLKYKGRLLVKGRDYSVKYKNNKKRGTAKIIITGKGNFAGKKTIKFKIK